MLMTNVIKYDEGNLGYYYSLTVIADKKKKRYTVRIMPNHTRFSSDVEAGVPGWMQSREKS